MPLLMVLMQPLFYVPHFKFVIFYISMLVVASSAKHHGNPANELVDIINQNRTAHKLKSLTDNPGLGCMALQYIDVCEGNCSNTNTLSCHPPEEDMTEIYAPNCGVELPTVDIISGRAIGCQSKYLSPLQVFSDVLVRDNKTLLSLVHDKQHTEVGVGFKRKHKGPFFWCVLFSSGQTNSTFVLEGGKGIKQKSGCFSGSDIGCNAAGRNWPSNKVVVLFSALLFMCFAHGCMRDL